MLQKIVAVAAATVLTAGAAWAASSVQVTGAWSRPAPAGGNGVVYATLTSTGRADHLVSASSPVAGRIEIHESMVMGGKAMMHSHPGGLDLAADKPVVLAAGGYHLMLIGLKTPLKVGETLPLTLKFQKAGTLVVQVPVRATAP
jgi:copper(I)-binding protein